MGGDGNGNISITDCAYCWVKNVEASWSIGSDIGLYQTFRNVLRELVRPRDAHPRSRRHRIPDHASLLAASENLIENNIFWYGNKVNTMRATGGGQRLCVQLHR